MQKTRIWAMVMVVSLMLAFPCPGRGPGSAARVDKETLNGLPTPR